MLNIIRCNYRFIHFTDLAVRLVQQDNPLTQLLTNHCRKTQQFFKLLQYPTACEPVPIIIFHLSWYLKGEKKILDQRIIIN